jgi:SNF family Na+-dependent transporter
MSDPTQGRERWGSRIGLILAMAGNAVGLGNFLRFPRQAVENGGGTFMIPYFIALILVGIPLMWIEWGVGRYGGQHGQGSTPGMFNALWKHPISKYLGVLGLFMPFIVMVYYCYLESQTLAWTFFSAINDMRGLETEAMRAYLASYQDLSDPSVHATWVPFVFYFVTLSVNFWVVSKGLAGGIEKLAKIGMPVLFAFAAVLVVRVLTLAAQPVPDAACAAATACSPVDGLNFMYTPKWEALAQPRVWLAATGQIFFTLSVGMGSLQAYASYLSKTDDIALSGIATVATNETAEVVLGGSLAIPAVVTFFGVAGAVSIAQGGSFDLGFIAMPLVFNQLPGGAIMTSLAGVMWFGLLFFAGITSSVSMITPVKAFLQENLGWTSRFTLRVLFVVAAGLGLLHVLYNSQGFLGEWDYWAGTFGLVVLALVETVIFVWIFGPDNAWRELHEGASIQIPRFFKVIVTYVTPVFLLVMMIWWTVIEAIPTLMMEGVPEEQRGVRTASRLVMLAVLLAQILLIRYAWGRKRERGTA